MNWKVVSGALLIVIISLSVMYQQNIHRLYTAITLYDQDKIVENFLTMPESFNASRIPASDTPFHFPKQSQEIPASFGLDDERFSTDDFLLDSGTTGLLVLKDGVILFEEYYLGNSEEQQHISFSVAKSFVSALLGIAIDEGKITSIDQAVTDYVPELKGTGYDGVRIKDILQMSSGVKFNEDYADFNSDINRFSRATAFGTSLDEFSSSLVREREPGIYHHYVSIDTQVLGMLLTRVTQRSLSDYLAEKIWQPLGMEYPSYWLADDDGMELALGGLNVSLRDYAKLGWLYLNKGKWGDRQIVPRQWVIDSVTPDSPRLMPGEGNPRSSSSDGYGYQWWVPLGAEDEFAARGIYSQYIYVDPDQSLVIVKTSANHLFTKPAYNWNAKHMALFRTISQHFEIKSFE
jgi:CubicO group peptidase (beta-lactamase class C family)